MARAASPRRSPLPVVSRCSTQKTSRDHLLAATCRVAVLDPETSRDHLFDRTIEFAPIFCARSRVLYKLFRRASAVVENRFLANCAVRQLSSNRAVDFCVTESKRSELGGTSDRASSRLLCIRCSVIDVKRRDDVASDPNNRSSTSPRASRVGVAENQDACRLCRTSHTT